MKTLLLTSLLASFAAASEEGTRITQDEEVVVYGDLFARWDGTRWFVDTQVGFPQPYVLFAVENVMMEAVAVEIRLVVACEKTWRRGKKFFEVDCQIEDVALQAASWRKSEPNAQRVLDELDAALSKARLQLVVNWDGRLDDIDLEGLNEGTMRELAVREQARQLLVRAMAGFHMKLPPENQVRQGQWVEYGSTLFQIPWMDQKSAAEAMESRRPPQIFNSIGGAYILHQVDPFQGHVVVQSVGQGTVLIGDQDTGNASFFKLQLDSVGIFDKASGFMTERVWTLSGWSTASSVLSDGRMDAVYFHNGRLRQLGTEDKPEVGPTRLVARPGITETELPLWEPLQ